MRFRIFVQTLISLIMCGKTYTAKNAKNTNRIHRTKLSFASELLLRMGNDRERKNSLPVSIMSRDIR